MFFFHIIGNISPTLLVSQGQTRCLKTTSMYSFIILSAIKSKIKVSARLVPSCSSEGKCVPCLCPGSWWFPAILASLAFSCILCHMAPLSDGCLTLFVCAFTRHSLLSVCLNLPHCARIPVTGLGPILIPYDIILN